MTGDIIKSGIRNIRKYAAHSALNISGMAIGMASAILLFFWIYEELSFDRNFGNADRLYRVIEKQNLSGGEASMMAIAPSPLAKTLKEEYPEIIRSARIAATPLTLKKGDEFVEETVVSVDRDFLRMFDIKFIEGDINSALNEPHNIIFTEEMARKYFGNDDALGKTLQSRGYSVTVSGIVKSFSKNCHLQFNFLIPIGWMKEFGAPVNDWRLRDRIYLELKAGTGGKAVESKIKDFIGKHYKESDSEILLQNIRDIHLHSSGKYVFDVPGNGDIAYVRIMCIIAIFILVIASINFMNLFTAQAAGRSKEIAVRKIVGADKRILILYFLGESLFILFVAIAIAMILVELALPGFNVLTGKHLTINFGAISLYLELIIFVLFCGLLAGGYPALYFSSLKPLCAVKDNIVKNPGNLTFRRILVIFQFALSTLLIVSTLIVRRQLEYIQKMDIGFNRKNLCYFMFPTRPGDTKLKSLKSELSGNQDIESVTIGRPDAFNNEGRAGGYTWEGKNPGDDVQFHFINVDEDYASTFQIRIKDGRFFSSLFSDANSIVTNETAVKAMGLKNPIGAIITSPRGSKLTIIGVVNDFHFQSLHYRIEPLILRLGDDNHFIIRFKPGKNSSIEESVNKIFKSFDPGLPLDFHFLDDDFANLYNMERRIEKIVRSFSLLAIIISCLGLLGLSSYLTIRKTKEIGIRKVNGAKPVEVFTMLSKEYIILVIISLLIACPAGWFVMNIWLQKFAYHITIGPVIFALTGIVVLTVTIISVGFQSIRTALKNPVESLRDE